MSNKTETYTLVINSATSTAISGNIDNRNYFVQWESVLPKKYNKYFVELNFMSAGSATVAPSLLSVGMNQSNTVELIGSNFCPSSATALLSVVTNGATLYFQSQPNYATIIYPTNQLLNVTLTKINTAVVPVYTDYILIMTFTPIYEDRSTWTKENTQFMNSM